MAYGNTIPISYEGLPYTMQKKIFDYYLFLAIYDRVENPEQAVAKKLKEMKPRTKLKWHNWFYFNLILEVEKIKSKV